MTHRLGAGAEAISIAKRLKNKKHIRVLEALADRWGDDGFCFASFDVIAKDTELDRRLVRRTVRLLARKGLAEYAKGLFTEDGEVAGSGYAVTDLGRVVSEIVKQPPRICSVEQADGRS